MDDVWLVVVVTEDSGALAKFPLELKGAAKASKGSRGNRNSRAAARLNFQLLGILSLHQFNFILW